MAEPSAREALLRAAASLFREGGAATVRAVCERAGVKPPTLYHHFGDLAGLHAAVVGRAFEASGRAKPGVAEGGALAAVRAGWDAYLGFAAAEPALFAVTARQMTAGPLPDAARASYEALVAGVRAMARERATRHAPELAAQMLWAAAHGAACLAAAGGFGFPADPALGDALREAVLGSVLAPNGFDARDG